MTGDKTSTEFPVYLSPSSRVTVQDMCASNPCFHEGTCIDMDNNTFKCLCKGGWKGQNCQGIARWHSFHLSSQETLFCDDKNIKSKRLNVAILCKSKHAQTK